MTEYVFMEKDKKPAEENLAETLGSTYRFWEEIKEYISESIGATTEEWKFYGAKYGWQLKTFLKKRNLFFLIPYDQYFRIGFVFGDRAVEAIEASGVSETLKDVIRNARKYGEGRGLPIDVKDGAYIQDIKALLEIKVNT